MYRVDRHIIQNWHFSSCRSQTTKRTENNYFDIQILIYIYINEAREKCANLDSKEFIKWKIEDQYLVLISIFNDHKWDRWRPEVDTQVKLSNSREIKAFHWRIHTEICLHCCLQTYLVWTMRNDYTEWQTPKKRNKKTNKRTQLKLRELTKEHKTFWFGWFA